jgi:endonuclease YncB( thermonuclease family)
VRPHPNAKILVPFALLLLVAAATASQSGRVVAVADGDTLTVQVEGRSAPVHIRLFGIDTPEGGQPYGAEARAALSELVAGRTLRLEERDVDAYGRIVARVFAGDTDVNAELVREGAAWVYRKYTQDERLIALEREARAEKRGLWALPASERVPPWKWRKSEHANADPKRDTRFSCDTKKTTCREMTSCAEALFYLRKCGLTRIDGNGDGVPCSGLCR